MKLLIKLITISIIASFASGMVGCKTKQSTTIKTPVREIEGETIYQGRITSKDDSTKIFYWSGTSAKIHFNSNTLSFKMKDSKGDNYYHALLDGNIVDVIQPSKTEETYEIYSEDTASEHTFELLKISEWTRGHTTFYGFDIGDGNILPLETKEKMMTFYGNSITSGYAVDDMVGDSPDGVNTNFAKSYAQITANHFDVNINVISRSGIGVMISWFTMIMPEMYDLLNPEDSQSKWDFSSDPSDVVVINLLQNDSWLVNRPEKQVFKDKFGDTPPTEDEIIDAYKDFILSIRQGHPESHIICMLGNMDISSSNSKWPSYVDKAILRTEDAAVTSLVVPYKNTVGHPDPSEQILLSTALIDHIESLNLLN